MDTHTAPAGITRTKSHRQAGLITHAHARVQSYRVVGSYSNLDVMLSRTFLRVVLFVSVLALLAPPADARPARVQIKRTAATSWELLVDGKPFYIRGVGVGRATGKKGENYLRMAKEMGANTVRTWGVDQGNRRYLDEANRQGLYVNAGIWLNHVTIPRFSYLEGSPYLAKAEKRTLEYVQKYKDHPAILMWNVGNEVISSTGSEHERDAFAQFLELLIQKIKAIDPNHPVVYAAKGVSELPSLKAYTLSLDAIGFNIYGSVVMTESGWRNIRFGLPYIATEFGPAGPWDLPRDQGGITIEEGDVSKAAQYRNHWNLLRERRGANLGGFAFHLGETTQESLSFWNLNEGEYKKPAFLTMQSLYLKKELKNHAPQIKVFEGVPAVARAGARFWVRVEAVDVDGDAISIDYLASTAIQGIEQYDVNEEVLIHVQKRGSEVEITAPKEVGTYRIYARARDGKGNASMKNSALRVIP